MVGRRSTLIALALAAVAGCDGGARSCKQGTALITIDVAAGVNADSLVLSISLDGAASKSETISHGGSGSVEIDFTGGYPAGSTLTVNVAAMQGATQVAVGHVAAALVPGCTAIEVAVGGSSDGGVKQQGTQCVPGDQCATGPCVDGYCCESTCGGQCEACNVTGSEGRCLPVPAGTPPHTGHPACAGDQTGPCAGSCDGASRTACTFPTDACGSPTCAGGVETTQVCAGGSCSPTPQMQTCSLGCGGASNCLGVVQVAAGYSFACAALTDKSVRCWGDNSNDQIGQFTGDGTASYKTPQQVANLSATQVAAVFGSFCALTTSHTIDCYGDNSAGQLGIGSADAAKHGTPATDVVGINDATYIGGASGGTFCAIITNGQIKCWGGNSAGQVGDGTVTAPPAGKPTPSLVCAPGSTATPCTPATGAVMVSGGDSHTCALFSDGSVACWGSNSQGQLGFTADAASHPYPIVVPGLSATAIHSGGTTNCVASGGLARCWGGNLDGHLGNGNAALTGSPTPVSVCTAADCSTLLMGVTQTSGVDEAICALAGGAVRCWGGAESGQLGDGTLTPESYAATQAIASGGLAVTAGGASAYAIVQNGTERILKCWGSNGVGELGDNGVAGTSSKVPVLPLW